MVASVELVFLQHVEQVVRFRDEHAVWREQRLDAAHYLPEVGHVGEDVGGGDD